MKVFTVHGPAKSTGDSAGEAERIVFVRDGFHFWAFLLAPIWMLWHRMWLVLLGYLALIIVLELAMGLVGAGIGTQFVIGVLLALLVGFEAGTLLRFTLRKRSELGVVAGQDREEAERRFFDAWAARDTLPPMPTAPTEAPSAPARKTEAAPEVIGLFPEPQPR